MIYEPLLIHTLEELIVSDRLDDLARVNICEQCIEGLAWIHKCGIMHRDIKPLNMGMKSISPPEAMIFDFGHGTAKQTSTDHYKGTIAYLAPEVLDLKFHKSDIPYNNAADVWAMGISAYQMMCRKKWRGLNMVKDEQKRICDYTLDRLVTARDDLQRCAQAQVASVIQKMLMETPSERIFAEDALAALMELDAGKTDRKLASKLKHTRDPIEMMEERTQPPASLMLRTSSLLSPSLPIA